MRTLCCVLLVACGASAPPPAREPPPRRSAPARHLDLGCRWDCAAGGACNLVCDVPDRKQCGDAHCGETETCCNASCGVCVPAGNFCFSQYCVRGALK